MPNTPSYFSRSQVKLLLKKIANILPEHLNFYWLKIYWWLLQKQIYWRHIVWVSWGSDSSMKGSKKKRKEKNSNKEAAKFNVLHSLIFIMFVIICTLQWDPHLPLIDHTLNRLVQDAIYRIQNFKVS